MAWNKKNVTLEVVELVKENMDFYDDQEMAEFVYDELGIEFQPSTYAKIRKGDYDEKFGIDSEDHWSPPARQVKQSQNNNKKQVKAPQQRKKSPNQGYDRSPSQSQQGGSGVDFWKLFQSTPTLVKQVLGGLLLLLVFLVFTGSEKLISLMNTVYLGCCNVSVLVFLLGLVLQKERVAYAGAGLAFFGMQLKSYVMYMEQNDSTMIGVGFVLLAVAVAFWIRAFQKEKY